MQRAPDPEVGGTRVHAWVQVGEAVTGYVRVGRGRTVVLVRGGGSQDPPPDGLLDRLADGFRVIAPTDAAPDGADGIRWLCDLMEGLGLDRPDLVFLGSLPWAGVFLRQHAHRVRRVVVLATETAAGASREDLAEKVVSLLGSPG